jgi:hypothetical protein
VRNPEFYELLHTPVAIAGIPQKLKQPESNPKATRWWAVQVAGRFWIHFLYYSRSILLFYPRVSANFWKNSAFLLALAGRLG